MCIHIHAFVDHADRDPCFGTSNMTKLCSVYQACLVRAGHDCGRYEDAIRLLMEVIKAHPYLQDTYHTLGLAHEALGRQRQALDFYMIAVHMAPSDVDLWRRLASLSTKLAFYRQAIYCYTKVWAGT